MKRLLAAVLLALPLAASAFWYRVIVRQDAVAGTATVATPMLTLPGTQMLGTIGPVVACVAAGGTAAVRVESQCSLDRTFATGTTTTTLVASLDGTSGNLSFPAGCASQFKRLRYVGLAGNPAGTVCTANTANEEGETHYLAVRRTGAAQVLSAGDIIFNTQDAAAGIPYNTATGVATLSAGVTYRISVTLHASNAALTWLTWTVVDSANASIGCGVAESVSIGAAGANADAGHLECIYTPTASTGVKPRIVGIGAGTTTIRSDLYNGMIVQQIGQ